MIAHNSAKTASSSQPELTISSATGPNTTLNNVNFNTTVLSIDVPHTPNNTTHGSNPPSFDELSHQASSVDQIRTQPVSSFSTPSKPIRKLTFTKPPRFRGPNRGSSPETTAATAGSPVHIGKGFLIAKLRDRGAGRNSEMNSSMARRERLQERDIYSLRSEEDIESIEDD